MVCLIDPPYPKGNRVHVEVTSRWPGLYKLTKEEIERALNYANSRIYLGSGSAGQVYQGVLPSGQLVAIKHIHKTAMSGSFMREVEQLSKVRHPNLVCLFGYCDQEGDQYLVYEYCANGNLAQNLLSKGNSALRFSSRFILSLLQQPSVLGLQEVTLFYHGKQE